MTDNKATGIFSLFDLAGKTALVTGGASGLGRMIAYGLVSAGAKVYITSRKPEDVKNAASSLSEQGGGECIGICSDLSSPEAISELVAEYTKFEESLHILINNAGRTWGARMEEFPDKAWAGVMALNVQVPFTLARDLLPQLLKGGRPGDPSRIINIGSLAGVAVERINAYSYSASKAAIHHLSRELAAELGPQGITVNTLVPGYFPTQMTAHIRKSAGAEAELKERIPLGRLGCAEDIAGACIMLASRAGSYINGTEFLLDGGLSGCR